MLQPELITCGELPRLRSVVVAGVFAALLLGTLALDLGWPAPKPPLDAQAASEDRARRAAANVRDGSRSRLVEDDLGARSRVRSGVVPVWSALLLRYAGAGNRRVIVGEPPWLFERARVESPPGFGPDGPELAGAYVSSLARRFEARGTRLLTAVVPRKAVVCDEFLPAGLAVDASLERRVVAAAEARGARMVRLVDRLSAVPPEDAFQPADTHWSLAGRRAFAEALRAAAPELAEPAPDVPFEIVHRQRENDLVGLLGIRGSAFAAGLIAAPPAPFAQVDPDAFWPRIVGGPGDGVISVAGTSYSAARDLQVLLSHGLGRFVDVRSLIGGRIGETLTRFLRDVGPAGLPRYVVHEFPFAFVALGIGAEGDARRALSETFWALPIEGAAPLGIDVARTNLEAAPGGETSLAVFPAGAVLVSGDGVAALRLDVASGAPFAARVALASFALDAERQVGLEPIDVPILSAATFEGPIVITAKTATDAHVDIGVSVVTDAALERAVALRAVGVDGEVQHFAAVADGTVGPFETLVLRGELKGALDVRASGWDASGEPLVQRWSFRRAAARTALLGLGRFAGGRLDAVVIVAESTSGALAVARAPLGVRNRPR